MGMGFPAERTHSPGVHKIGAAISGPRIADRTFYGHEDFSESCDSAVIQIRVRIMRCQRPTKRQKPEPRETKARLYCSPLLRESLNGGLANGGLRCLSTIVHDCLHLSSFSTKVTLLESDPKGHKCAQSCANCREWP